MKKLLIIFVLCLATTAWGDITLEVIYPSPNQRIAAVDSNFIFGHVTPGSRLTINGVDVMVHKEGGWLAYLPVTFGEFNYHIEAWLGDINAALDLPVWVGVDSGAVYVRPIIPDAIIPDSQMVFSVGDIFEFSFKAPPGGRGWFNIDKCDSVIMLETKEEDISAPGDVFGQSSRSAISGNFARYTGRYRIAAADTGKHCIYYRYQYPPGSDTAPPLRGDYLFTDSILTIIPEFPPVVGVLSGRSQIIRTGPGMGYKLLYQPPGIKVLIKGERNSFYKLALADGITGYTNIDSVTILKPGAPPPKGRVAFISVDCKSDGVILKARTGEKLPFEITETMEPFRLDIDIFGVTGDVDWIRYNNKEIFDGIVTWSQPQDGVFRVTVESPKFAIGGYKPYYDGDTFTLEINKKKLPRHSYFKALKGMRIAIDPGHSHDSGAKGPTGLWEMDANLWIAHELRLILLDAGAEVMMTRYGHEHIPLYDRPKMAEKWGADILISIHNNALPDGINPFENNGTSVYYYHPHSKLLAESIHKHLVKATKLNDHGLYYGNLVLTRPTEMPAVLVECAFMMIPEQEAKLKTDKFQRKCAQAIYNGIIDYLRK